MNENRTILRLFIEVNLEGVGMLGISEDLGAEKSHDVVADRLY